MNIDYSPDYETLKCDDCGGTIGIYDRLICKLLNVEYYCNKPICGRCGKEFNLYQLAYDYIEINDKTGWAFPVISKEKQLWTSIL